ncbi:hypothetical protein ANANG_G00106400 [Anguilla anguilla]|uniref:Uncharacterized protein n=1 Tax=Anguilla anguilla TaxID=7936 RepID=A0A9D3MJH3_ANGAN|nr:hypothetical protein ANANG_G00106400 [Anguilla anguilla]
MKPLRLYPPRRLLDRAMVCVGHQIVSRELLQHVLGDQRVVQSSLLLVPQKNSAGNRSQVPLMPLLIRKRARNEVVGVKEKYVSGDRTVEELDDLKEDAELEGIYRLQELDEYKETGGDLLSTEVAGLRSRKQGDKEAFIANMADKSQHDRLEDVGITETLSGQFAGLQSQTFDDKLPCFPGEGSVLSAGTPPNTKVRKPVSASGILALTQSPMLYKGKKQRDESESGSHLHKAANVEPELSPFSRPPRRRASSKTYSRKRLLD